MEERLNEKARVTKNSAVAFTKNRKPLRCVHTPLSKTYHFGNSFLGENVFENDFYLRNDGQISKEKDMLAAEPQAIPELPCASVSKRVPMENFSGENEFDLHENEPMGGTHFHMNGFARRLVSTQRQKTRKRPFLESRPPKLDKNCQYSMHSSCMQMLIIICWVEGFFSNTFYNCFPIISSTYELRGVSLIRCTYTGTGTWLRILLSASSETTQKLASVYCY